eukprot:TRINITY_DN4211_c0_g2_i1.p5 TRINITY_DN4211_c0_g2~~TRINITY_DN4211_c0_g2_i1.p5  ORF type:complete len:62 (-),score=22.54 TRINITY_DN4211_c0_g2_i1:2-187(-)
MQEFALGPVRCFVEMDASGMGTMVNAPQQMKTKNVGYTGRLKKKKYRLRGRSSETAKAHRG